MFSDLGCEGPCDSAICDSSSSGVGWRRGKRCEVSNWYSGYLSWYEQAGGYGYFRSQQSKAGCWTYSDLSSAPISSRPSRILSLHHRCSARLRSSPLNVIQSFILLYSPLYPWQSILNDALEPSTVSWNLAGDKLMSFGGKSKLGSDNTNRCHFSASDGPNPASALLSTEELPKVRSLSPRSGEVSRNVRCSPGRSEYQMSVSSSTCLLSERHADIEVCLPDSRISFEWAKLWDISPAYLDRADGQWSLDRWQPLVRCIRSRLSDQQN